MNPNVPKELTERNQRIYQQVKSGVPMVEIISEHKISASRISKIVKREEKRREQ